MSFPVTDREPAAIETFRLEGGRPVVVLGAAAAAMAVETVGLALLLGGSRPIVGWIFGWIFGAANAAVVFWMWRNQRSYRHSAIVVAADRVTIRFGPTRVEAPRASVARADRADWRSVPATPEGYLNFAYPDAPNVLVRFRVPIPVRLALGIRKAIDRVGMRVDRPDALVALLAADRAGMPAAPNA